MPAKFERKEYKTFDELLAAVQDYITKCESYRPPIFPDLAGMRIYLGINKKQMEEYMADPEFAEIFYYAADCRESFLVREMSSDNKKANGCLNALKQPDNGGYADRPKENTQKKIVVEFKDTAIEASDFE